MDLEAFELVLLRTPEHWYCPPGTMSKPGRAVTL